jgi:hypothetical protein
MEQQILFETNRSLLHAPIRRQVNVRGELQVGHFSPLSGGMRIDFPRDFHVRQLIAYQKGRHMTVDSATDHGGFGLKEELMARLHAAGPPGYSK